MTNLIDTSTDFGKRVTQRLKEDQIAWLTTVDSSGTPQPRPIWFLWNGESFFIYTQPDGYKVKHVKSNPRVSISLDSDGHGGDIVVLIGNAEVVTEVSKEDIAAYVDKYREGMKRIGMDEHSFAESYRLAIRVVPDKLRGH